MQPINNIPVNSFGVAGLPKSNLNNEEIKKTTLDIANSFLSSPLMRQFNSEDEENNLNENQYDDSD